jgi:hypothetical protein
MTNGCAEIERDEHGYYRVTPRGETVATEIETKRDAQSLAWFTGELMEMLAAGDRVEPE